MTTEATSPAEKTERPEQLELLDRWARVLGMATAPTTASAPGGRTVQGLEIQRGELNLVAFALPPAPSPDGQFLVLRALIEIPASVREAIAGRDSAARGRLTDAVYASLMSQGRTAFQVHPSGAADAASIEQIGIEQVLRLEEGNTATFNRLADAVQELATTLGRLGRHYLEFVPGPGGA